MKVKSHYLNTSQVAMRTLIMTLPFYVLAEFIGLYKVTYYFVDNPMNVLVIDAAIVYCIVFIISFIKIRQYKNIIYQFGDGYIIHINGIKTAKLLYSEMIYFKIKRELYGMFGYFKVSIVMKDKKIYNVLLNKDYELVFLRWFTDLQEQKKAHYDFYLDESFKYFIEAHIINKL